MYLLYQVASATARFRYIISTTLSLKSKNSSSFCIYVLLLNHHKTTINIIQRLLLCLVYHFYFLSTTIYLNFLSVLHLLK